MAAQRPDVTRLYEGRDLFRVDVAVVVPDVFVVHLGEEFIYLRCVKARRAQVIARGLQVAQKVGQCHRFPFSNGLIECDIERLLILRVFDMHHHAVDLRRALIDQHLVALMSADNVAGHFVPDHRIDITEVVQAALDLFIRRVAGLEILAGIVFRGLEFLNGNALQVHLCIHFIILSGNGTLRLIIR